MTDEKEKYRMLGRDGNTVEAIRELINVPPKIERVLLAFARTHPEEAHSIAQNLKFRVGVFQSPKCRKWRKGRRARNRIPLAPGFRRLIGVKATALSWAGLAL